MSNEKTEMLEAARRELQYLTKADITELAAFKNPPDAVRQCTEAVYILLLGQKPHEWRVCINLFRSTNLIQTLLTFDLDNAVNDTKMKELEPYINDPEFQPDVLAKKSVAAKAFCQWVRGVYNYQLIQKANP